MKHETKRQQNRIENIELKFKNILIGTIGNVGHIKGKGDPVYHRLMKRIKQLVPEIYRYHPSVLFSIQMSQPCFAREKQTAFISRQPKIGLRPTMNLTNWNNHLLIRQR